MAVSINSVFDPLGMVTGGFSGIAILIKELTKQLIPGGMPLGITTAVLNVPLFLIGIKIKGFPVSETFVCGDDQSFRVAFHSPADSDH